MDFSSTPEDEAFRADVRSWLKDKLPPGCGPKSQEPIEEEEWAAFRLDWEKSLYRGGWSGIIWPKEYGGRGATIMQQAIFSEEELPAGQEHFKALNAELTKGWPVITEKKDAPADAKSWDGKPDKLKLLER